MPIFRSAYFCKFCLYSLFLLMALSSETLFADAADEPAYVGSKGCGCHRLEISDWEMSSHAKAFNLLFPGIRKAAKKRAKLDPFKDYSKNSRCLKCHTVGYKKTGGFLDYKSTPELAGVGCESCHGPGEKYRRLHGNQPLTFTRGDARAMGQVYSSVDTTVCAACHGHSDSPFQAHMDKKYSFDLKKGTEKTSSFHSYYEIKGNH